MDMHRFAFVLAVLLLMGCTPTWQAPAAYRLRPKLADRDACEEEARQAAMAQTGTGRDGGGGPDGDLGRSAWRHGAGGCEAAPMTPADEAFIALWEEEDGCSAHAIMAPLIGIGSALLTMVLTPTLQHYFGSDSGIGNAVRRDRGAEHPRPLRCVRP